MVGSTEAAPATSGSVTLFELPAELAPLFLERLAFPHLLTLRLASVRLNTLSLLVTRLTLTQRNQLFIPLLRPLLHHVRRQVILVLRVYEWW